MVLAEQWQYSLYANVLSVQSSVPSMFLYFFGKRTGYEGTGTAFSDFWAVCFRPSLADHLPVWASSIRHLT